jgi:hypothetical protein
MSHVWQVQCSFFLFQESIDQAKSGESTTDQTETDEDEDDTDTHEEPSPKTEHEHKKQNPFTRKNNQVIVKKRP